MSHAITDEEFKARVADYNRERGATNSPTTNGAEVVSLASGVKLNTAAKSFQWLDMSNWDNEPVPERQWAIKDRVPLNQAGLFSGEGGTGKSIIELMKDVAHVTGKDWLGSMPEPGPAFYIGAEDDENEIHIRLAAIASHYGVTFKELIDGGLHVLLPAWRRCNPLRCLVRVARSR